MKSYGHRSQVALAMRWLMTVAVVIFGFWLSMPPLVGAEKGPRSSGRRSAGRARADGQTEDLASRRRLQLARDREAAYRKAAEAHLRDEIRRRANRSNRRRSSDLRGFRALGGLGGFAPYGGYGLGGYGGGGYGGGYGRGTSGRYKSRISRQQRESILESLRKANYQKNVARAKKREKERREKWLKQDGEQERVKQVEEQEQAKSNHSDLSSPVSVESLCETTAKASSRICCGGLCPSDCQPLGGFCQMSRQ